MKQGKNCDVSGGQCKSGLELASSAKGEASNENLRHYWWWVGLGWVLGELAKLGGGDKLEDVELIPN